MAAGARGRSARPLLISALIGAIAVVALLNWHLYTTPIDVSALTPQARSADSTQAKEIDLATPLDDKPLIVFEETVERPLFNGDRKPIERNKQVVEAPVTVTLNADMQLVGIVKSAGAPARALIRFAGEPMGKWVPEGETVNGWQLTAVKAFSVVLEGNGATHELKLPSVVRQTTDERETSEPRPEPSRRKKP
jgi:hypothetical protein